MNKYRLINYFDVWGNEKDGWEINNQCVEREDLMVSDDSTDKQILTLLKHIGFLVTDDMRQLVVENNGTFVEIFQRKGLKPICALMQVEV